MRYTCHWIVLLLAAVCLADDRPNVVVVLADDQRAMDLGVAGHPVIGTPTIDALAERGVYFTNAFVTSAACTPSRTSILMGQYERRHGVTFGSQSALTEQALARSYPMLLKQAGYFTGYVGKNHTPIGRTDRGFGYKSGVMERAFDYWYAAHGHLQFYPKKRHRIFKNAEADTQIEIIEQAVVNFLTPSDAFIKTAGPFAARRPAGRPFCLLVNFNVPHSAATLRMQKRPDDPPLYRTAYRNQMDQLPIPPTYRPADAVEQPKIPAGVYNGRFIPSYDYVKNPASLREQMVREAQTITGMDRVVETLVRKLKQIGELDNTIIVYFSDHGIQHGEFGLGGKVLLYEPSIRAPLIIYDPRQPADHRGRRIERFALNIDLAPTLLELCGVEAPAGVQGRSLVPLMRGEQVEWREDFFLENMFMGQNYPRIEGVRGERYKYLRYFDKKKDQHHYHALTASIRGEQAIHEELYDLRRDPHETRNLADDPAHAATLDQMRARCQTLVTELYGDEPPDTHVRGVPDH